jgi:hypothetical protein
MGSENRQELERLESTLADSDPALAGKYGIFNRLAEDEPFARAEPVPERAAPSPIPARIPSPRPVVREPRIPIPRPGAPWGAGPRPGSSFSGGKEQPVSRPAREPRADEPAVLAPVLGPWLLPLVMFFILAGVMVLGLAMSG